MEAFSILLFLFSLIGIGLSILLAFKSLIQRTGRAKIWGKRLLISIVIFFLSLVMIPTEPDSTDANIQTDLLPVVQEYTSEDSVLVTTSETDTDKEATTPSNKNSDLVTTSEIDTVEEVVTPPTEDATESDQEQSLGMETVTVSGHVDGDTIDITDASGTEHRVRLIGIDTPETKHPTNGVEYFGKEASSFTQESLPLGSTVYLQKDVSETDRYDRLLRYVWIERPASDDNLADVDSKMFNAMLVIGGFAQASTYPPDVLYADHFADLQSIAIESATGLWVEPDEESITSEPKESTLDMTGATYVGSSQSDKYHYLDCTWANKISPENLVKFVSMENAVAAGYVACGVCTPPSPVITVPEPEPQPVSATYVGSSKSDKFHYPSCRYAKNILPENLISFSSRNNALSSGYTPCGGCKP